MDCIVSWGRKESDTTEPLSLSLSKEQPDFWRAWRAPPFRKQFSKPKVFGLEKRGQDECLKRAAVGGLIGRKRNRFYSVVFGVLFFFFFSATLLHSFQDLSSLDQRLNPGPQKWKRWVLTNGQPGKSQMSSVLDGYRIRCQCKLQGGQLQLNTKEQIYGSIIKWAAFQRTFQHWEYPNRNSMNAFNLDHCNKLPIGLQTSILPLKSILLSHQSNFFQI